MFSKSLSTSTKTMTSFSKGDERTRTCRRVMQRQSLESLPHLIREREREREHQENQEHQLISQETIGYQI